MAVIAGVNAESMHAASLSHDTQLGETPKGCFLLYTEVLGEAFLRGKMVVDLVEWKTFQKRSASF